MRESIQTMDTATASDLLGEPLRGPTPFEDMIFYLWTDSNEICTAYVKLKINHILFLKNF